MAGTLAHRWAFCAAIGLCVFSIPILAQQVVSYSQMGRELGQQMLRAWREAERAEELRHAAEHQPPMTATDEHTLGYTKVVPAFAKSQGCVIWRFSPLLLVCISSSSFKLHLGRSSCFSTRLPAAPPQQCRPYKR